MGLLDHHWTLRTGPIESPGLGLLHPGVSSPAAVWVRASRQLRSEPRGGSRVAVRAGGAGAGALRVRGGRQGGLDRGES